MWNLFISHKGSVANVTFTTEAKARTFAKELIDKYGFKPDIMVVVEQ